MNSEKRTIAIICGGPSAERGISLNSARSLMDHLSDDNTTIVPFYVDQSLNFYRLQTAQMYSNTPSDFDFKLPQTAQILSEKETIEALRAVDVVFPAIHGAYGETGELQAFLTYHHIPFVGSDAYACQNMYYKNRAADILKRNGFDTIPSCLLRADKPYTIVFVEHFWKIHDLKRAVIKPAAGGSSIGVHVVTTVPDALLMVERLFAQGHQELIIEPYCEGREFTILVMENREGQPVALIPSEIQISYDNNAIFDYRRKYLPSSNTAWPCPPNFPDDVIEAIRTQAEAIFKLFYMRHFARLDGWILNDGRIIFTDFNPISGMEQNSFLFLQASRCGMTHKDVLNYIVENAIKVGFDRMERPGYV